jgi:hypothetical protein
MVQFASISRLSGLPVTLRRIGPANEYTQSANGECESANPLASLALSGSLWLHMADMAHRETATRFAQTTSWRPRDFVPGPNTGELRSLDPHTGDAPCEPQGEDFSPSPASLPQPGTLSVPPNGGPQLRRPPRRNTTAKRPQPLSQREQQQIRLVTARAYFRFCSECSMYPHNLANYLLLMDWTDERRIEMQAEGRRHWVPSVRDFEQAMRDCWDDLVKQ